MNFPLETSWKQKLAYEFEKPYFQDIQNFIQQERIANKTIYPQQDHIFAALNSCPFLEVKVVILGQDPYHGLGQAHGLSFSVTDGVKIPPSLRNIFKELKFEGYHAQHLSPTLIPFTQHLSPTLPQGILSHAGNGIHLISCQEREQVSGDLSQWAKQGVLLLNSILTVEAGKPASHSKIGWETFTDSIISKLSQERAGIIFVLWGNFARSKKNLINTTKHLVLEAPHPSPFSAHTGFFGCGHFRKVNEILEERGENGIRW